MKFIDANVHFGKELINHEIVNHENFVIIEPVSSATNASELIEYLDHFDIEQAVVGHSAMTDFDPVAGNSIIVDEIQRYEKRLIPSWTILPEITDSQFGCDVFFDKMKNAKVKILRSYPQINRYLLNSVTMKDQLDIICELKIPLYLEFRFGPEYIYNILSEFPELTLIITNIGVWSSARFIYPLLKKYKNVYFESGDFTMVHGHEEIWRKFGCERLLFSTNFPSNNMGCAITAIMHANIPIEQKEIIAYKNIERILKEVKL
jgi:hypothetical protein